MSKKAKCEKCEHCKTITQYGIIACDYLNELNKSLTSQAFCRPTYCGGFSKKMKGKIRKDKTNKPICPKCGGPIECNDTSDIEYNEDEYIDFCVGHCRNCNREYQWKGIYIFKKIESLEEVY